jgi:predicted CopG family antitoxin
MTNITLSIDDEVYKKMRRFSEIKWSEFVRKCVQKRVEELESIKSNIYADEDILAKNWLSEEDVVAWKDL